MNPINNEISTDIPKENSKTISSESLLLKNKDPLHGITLKMIVEYLHNKYGWEKLANKIDIKCFKMNPSINSSLTFLRKTAWARSKVETLYLQSIRGKVTRHTNFRNY